MIYHPAAFLLPSDPNRSMFPIYVRVILDGNCFEMLQLLQIFRYLHCMIFKYVFDCDCSCRNAFKCFSEIVRNQLAHCSDAFQNTRRRFQS
jgi:hypothetical protein